LQPTLDYERLGGDEELFDCSLKTKRQHKDDCPSDGRWLTGQIIEKYNRRQLDHSIEQGVCGYGHEKGTTPLGIRYP
jgi:hypothetical protein